MVELVVVMNDEFELLDDWFLTAGVDPLKCLTIVTGDLATSGVMGVSESVPKAMADVVALW